MSEISSLTSQVQQLGKSVDFWNTAVNVVIGLTAPVGVAYLGATLRQSAMSKRLRSAQDLLLQAKDNELKSELKQKDLEIGKAQEAAATANEAAGDANKSAGEANERASNLEKEAAVARERAGKLEQEAQELHQQNLATETTLESERKTRLELESSLAPREAPFITYTDETTNIDDLRPFAGTKYILECVSDLEAKRAASNIAALLKTAGWTLVSATFVEDAPEGVTLENPPAPVATPAFPVVGPHDFSDAIHIEKSEEVLRAFLVVNKWKVISNWAERGTLPPDTLRILVGLKPSPYFRKQVSPELREIMDREEEAKTQLVPNATAKNKPIKDIIFLGESVHFSRPPNINK